MVKRSKSTPGPVPRVIRQAAEHGKLPKIEIGDASKVVTMRLTADEHRRYLAAAKQTIDAETGKPMKLSVWIRSACDARAPKESKRG